MFGNPIFYIEYDTTNNFPSLLGVEKEVEVISQTIKDNSHKKDTFLTALEVSKMNLSLTSTKSHSLETQANTCNYHNWEKYTKTYENKKNYVLICFNTDNWESKSDFVFLFYEEMRNEYSFPQILIERTFIRWKEKYPTLEYKMISFEK